MRSHSIRPAVRDPKRDTDQHTFILAAPPNWTIQAMCAGDFARYDDSVGLKEGEAAARCKGCPVIAECLSAAQAEEGDLSAGNRYGIRGGFSPKERADLAYAERACARGHRNRWGEQSKASKPVCLECIAEDKRNAYATASEEFRAHRAATLRKWRDERRVTCLECKQEMWSEHLSRHVSAKHDEERAG